ncbi:MAG: hypothetical protein NTX24_03120 [Candidatus Pacearchaeota archaeon]|nr:hypothetical protein [Candidatus Pacearchaeota archaeon]
MAWAIFNQVFELFTSSTNELLIALAIFAIIFFVVFDIILNVAKFNKGASIIIALAIAMMAVFSGLTTKAMHFVYAFGAAGFMVVVFVLIIIAFVSFIFGAKRRR